MKKKRLKAFLLASPCSGSGKTTVCAGLISALRSAGYTVQPFKAGPDYIDAAYHAQLAGRACVNLDTWMSSPSFVRRSFARHCRDADLALVEGVMGLYDGVNGPGTDSSSAGLAKILGIPVVLVIDASSCCQSAAAIVLGCERYDRDLRFAGVIFNKVAGESHFAALKAAVEKHCASKVLGWLPKEGRLKIAERQLGLVSVHEQGMSEKYLSRLRQLTQDRLRPERLLEELEELALPATPGAEKTRRRLKSPVRIAIAADKAFCFYYQDNLDLLREAGAALIPFSPLAERGLPPGVAGLYFGGGFPEEFAARLAANREMLRAVRSFPGAVLAECGGLIYLCRSFFSAQGREYAFAGRIPGTIEMSAKLQGFGYREVTLNVDSLLGGRGARLRGHEFHWSRWRCKPQSGWGVFSTAEDTFGYGDKNTLASFFHFHLGSNPAAARCFVERCAGKGGS